MINSRINLIGLALVMLVVGVGLGYTFAGPGYGGRAGHMMPNGSMPARQSLGVGGMMQNIDQHFIVEMIPHHVGAIEMARVALERSKRPEIRTLAEGIIEAQTREIGDMTAWYEDWFGSAPPAGGMGGMHMGSMEGDTAVLASVGDAQFDREFMEQMIPHHEMAIMMAQMLAAGTERREMSTLADQIITSQSLEIQMMRNWLKDWY
ncbi:MAG TPA: DUF305 domain-containing protein [Candidatus Paceibacterota bacterium]